MASLEWVRVNFSAYALNNAAYLEKKWVLRQIKNSM